MLSRKMLAWCAWLYSMPPTTAARRIATSAPRQAAPAMAASRRSPRTISTSLATARRNGGTPSRRVGTTSAPQKGRRRSTRWLPMKPEPPVTRTRLPRQ